MSTQHRTSSSVAASEDNFQESPLTCCGCINVETAAVIIALIGIIASVFLVIPHSDVKPLETQANAFAGCLGFVVHACVLVAQRLAMPPLYLPYLALCGASIIGSLTITLYLVYVLCVLPAEILVLFQAHDKVYLRSKLFLIIVVQLALTPVPVCFGWVVYKAYKCTKKRLASPASNV